MNKHTTNIEKKILELTTEISELEKIKAELAFEVGRIHHNNDVDKYLRGYSGTRLMKSHKLTDYGIWEILGEDPNCDLGGSHIQPHIAYVEGTLENTLLYAVKQPKWYCWGSGGDIKPIPGNLIIKV